MKDIDLIEQLSSAVTLLRNCSRLAKPLLFASRLVNVQEALDGLKMPEPPTKEPGTDIDPIAECERLDGLITTLTSELGARVAAVNARCDTIVNRMNECGLNRHTEQLAELTGRVDSSVKGILDRFELNTCSFRNQTIKINAVDGRVAELTERVDQSVEWQNLQQTRINAISCRLDALVPVPAPAPCEHPKEQRSHTTFGLGSASKAVERCGACNALLHKGVWHIQFAAAIPQPTPCAHPEGNRITLPETRENHKFELCLSCGSRRWGPNGTWVPLDAITTPIPKFACAHPEWREETWPILGEQVKIPVCQNPHCAAVRVSSTWFVPQPQGETAEVVEEGR